MLLVESFFLVPCALVGLGLLFNFQEIFKNKKFDHFGILMIIVGLAFGTIFFLIVKYTFIEGIFFNCPNIQLFCK